MNRTIVLILVLLFGFSSLFGQQQEDIKKRRVRYGFDINRRPPVNFNIFVSYYGKEWHPELFIGITVQNDVLQFAKSSGTFLANYQITVAIRNAENDNTILKETYTERVVEGDFEITNSKREYQYHSYQLSDIYPRGDKRLDPGKYECLLELRDLTSKKSYLNKRTFLVDSLPENAEKAKPSEIVFLFDVTDGEDTFALTPSADILDFNKSYRAYSQFPIVNTEKLPVNVRIYKESREGAQLLHQVYQEAIPDSNQLDFVYDIPEDILEEGRYKIRFSGTVDSLRFDQEKRFRVVWFDKPIYLYKADLAIRPLKYVLPEDEFKEVRKQNYSELQDWLKSYWKEKDPDSSTVYNELLFEFYDRVDIANREYTTRFKEGWETDQGKVLILYGKPEKIENKRYQANTIPYIEWHYRNGNLVFTFTDADQDGEFTLKTIDN